MENLFEILDAGVSPFHCVDHAVKNLKDKGFEELDYGKFWQLVPGGKYVLAHHGTTLFAFTIGKDYEKGDMIRLAGAHTDYPNLRLKPHADFMTKSYAQVNVEVYGGAILSTWMDRPLGLAGRVMVRSKDLFAPKAILYRSKRPLLVIPNLAIHMNRAVNEGVELNRQVDMMPILDSLPGEMRTTDYFLSFLAEELDVKKEDILDFELGTFEMQGPCYVGARNTMVSSPRIDNQTSCAALLSAIEDGERADGINLIALFDNEEVGSKGKQGAGSTMLLNLLRRILVNLGHDLESAEADMYRGMLLSLDVAHALHPNKQGKMDITNQPVLGRGFCIKEACSQSYATDAEAISILRQICDQEGIPYQHFVNRSDMKGGGTIGSIISSVLPVPTVDMGVPQLAMHSARELMSEADQDALTAAVTAFFKA